MAYRPLRVADAQAALALLADPAFDPAAELILLGETAATLAVAEPNRAPLVKVKRVEPRLLQIDVETDTPGFLVISEWYGAGWRATVNGERTPIYPADFALQALWLPAGAQQVTLHYSPLEVPIGALISSATLVAVLLITWRARFRIGMRSSKLTCRISWPRLPGATAVAASLRLKRRYEFWVAVVLTFLAFGLRLYRVDYQELRGDEAFSYLFAVEPAAQIIPNLIAEGDPHSPLHYLSLHYWMDLAGDGELALRYLSLLAGAVLAPLMYQLGRELANRRLGLLLAFFVAISPSQVWISQDVRNQYVFALLFGMLATLLLIRYMRHPRWWLLALYALSCALTIYAHYYGLFALAAQGVYVAAVARERKLWLFWLLAVAVAALLFLPWAVAVGPSLLAAGQLGDPDAPELARHLIAIGSELAAGPTWAGRWARWLFIFLSAVGGIGAVYLWKRRKPLGMLLLVWLFGAAVGIYLVRFQRSTFNDFYIAIAAPAWWALVGAGLLAIWQRARSGYRAFVLATVVLVTVVSAIGLARYYFLPAYSRTLGYRQIAQQLSDSGQAGDIFIAHFPDPSFGYYLRHTPMPRTMQPAAFPVDEQQTNEALADLASEYERLWFVPAHRSVWDPEDAAFRWLDYHTLLEEERVYDRLTLAAYRPLPQTPAVMIPLHVALADAIGLDGAYLTVDGIPQPLRSEAAITIMPGANLIVSLVWTALEELPQDYTVLVHLIGEDGQLIAQHDGAPATGTRQTTTWEVSEQILDKHLLTMPGETPAGSAQLVVGIYDPATLERLRLPDGSEAIWLAEFSILLAASGE